MTEATGTASVLANADGGFPLQDALSIGEAVVAAGETTYAWDIQSDALTWGVSAPAILQRPAQALGTGKQFAGLLHSENLISRYDAVINSTNEDHGDGVPYHIEYQLKGDPAANLSPMWIEDRGRWFADRNGRPCRAVGVLRPVTDRHTRDQKLSELSHTDPLTGMMNRARLDEALEEAIGEARSNEVTCAFAVATIRNLSVVNEAYGFEVADEVIAALAERLRAVMRTGDGIARYSGSKFGFILNNCSGAELPVAIERFLNVARDSVIETSHGPVWALLSVGAVLLPIHADTSVSARALAEEALSAALRLSSDSFVVHMPSETVNSARMLNTRCAAEIVECLKAHRFQLAFQPLVNARTGEIACHEALLRMRDASGEVVTAGHLVPVAERLGLIRLVDRAVVQLALETLHRHSDAFLSINLSATTSNDPRWNAQIIDMIQMAGDVASRLTVEITETTALTDLTAALAFLEKLRSTGCCVAIDDFGAGFTSFRNLRDLPVDIIKLDGSYCRNLAKDTENLYFARTLIEMAHHFGIRTVAEWVETEADAEILRSLGVDFLQGNHMGTPDMQAPWAVTAPSVFTFEDAMPDAVAALEVDAAIAAEPDSEPSPAGVETDMRAARMDDSTETLVDEPLADDVASEFLTPAFEAHEEACAPVMAEPAPAEEIFAEEETQLPFPEAASEETHAVSSDVGETATVSLNDEVDQSLARLRDALDLLTRELSSGVEPQADDGAGVRLAG